VAVQESIRFRLIARDEASRKARGVGNSFRSMGQTIKGVAAGMLGALGITAALAKMIALMRESTELMDRQMRAETGMRQGLRLLGPDIRTNLKDMKEFASSIQSMTEYGDEAVLELASLGATMGRFADDELKRATKAAIGFSKAFGIDAKASMTLLAKAAQGNFSSLSRYGIQVDETASQQQKLNDLLKRGVDYFNELAAGANDATKDIKQAENALGDIKEELGETLIGARTYWAFLKLAIAQDIKGLFAESAQELAFQEKLREQRREEWAEKYTRPREEAEAEARRQAEERAREAAEERAREARERRTGVGLFATPEGGGRFKEPPEYAELRRKYRQEAQERERERQEDARAMDESIEREKEVIRLREQEDAHLAAIAERREAAQRMLAARALAAYDQEQAALAMSAPALYGGFMRQGRQTMAPAQQQVEKTAELIRITQELVRKDEERNTLLKDVVAQFDNVGVVVPGGA